MDAVIILRREVHGGELATHEWRCTLGVATEEFDSAETVALGLEDAAVLDGAELADRPVGRAENGVGSFIQRARAVFQGAGEERVEMFVSTQVLDLRFAHVDLVLLGEPRDQRILQPGDTAFGNAADQARQQVMRQQVLAEDKKTLFHRVSLKVLNRHWRGQAGCN